MPAVVAGVVKFIAWVWAGKGFAAAAIKLVASAAASYAVSRALAPKGRISSIHSEGTQVNVRDPAAPHRIVWGQRRVSGVMYPVATSGTNNEYLHLLLLLASHECEELGDVTFNDEVVPLDGSGNATGRYAGFVRIKKHLGAYNQTVDTALQADLGAGYWSNDHRLQGIAYLYIRLKVSADLFPGGIPELYCLVKGRKVYDWRSGGQSPTDATTWAWSNNAALCRADWIRGVPTRNGAGTIVRNYGLGSADDEINATAVEEAANVSDESVVLADTTTEPRYAFNGSLSSSTRAGDGIEAMKTADAGDAVWVGGEWIIRSGAYRTPTVTLTQTDLRAGLSGVRLKPSRTSLVNVVRGLYISETNAWQPTDFPKVPNATYKTQDGGEDLPMDIELLFTTSPATAQRLGKILMERSRQGITFTMRCKLTALQNQCTDVVLFTYARFGWSAKPFEVVGFAFAADNDENGNPYLGVDLTLRETASGVWDWADGEETEVDPAPNTLLRSPFDIEDPTSLSVTNSVQQQADGTTIPRLQVSWTAPADANVTTLGGIRVEYKLAAASDWLPVDFIRGDITTAFILAVVIGQSYVVRIRSETDVAVSPNWVTSGSTTVTGDTTAPSSISAPTVTAYPGYNRIEWAKSTADDIAEYRIYRNTVNATSGVNFILLGENDGLEWNDPTAVAGTTYWYFILPVDASENPPVGTITNISAGTSVVTALAPVGAVVPTDPTAATLVTPGSDDTYLSGDGTVVAFITIALPALPANAVWQNILSRMNGAADWRVEAIRKNTGSTNVRIDGLVPGQYYDIGTQAWSGAGGSNVVGATSHPYLAPNRTTGPSAPTSVTYIAGNSGSFLRPPPTYGAVPALATRVNWTPPSDKQVAYYEWAVSAVDSDAAATAAAKFTETGPEAIYQASAPISAYFRVRAVDRTGNHSAWAGGGTNLNTVMGFPAGTMISQDTDSVLVTGITTGPGSSQRQVLARQPIYGTVNITGGATSETINLSLTNYGFGTRPDAGWIQFADWDRICCRYDIDDSSSTNAVLRLTMSDGSNLPALSGTEITGEFVEYN